MENLTNTMPTIVKRIEQTELNEITKLISDCHILPVSLIKRFLEKRDKNESQIENILNQMVKRKLAYYDETKTYLKVNKAFSSANISMGLVKSLWLMIELLNNIEEYFVQTKNPHMLTSFNKTAEKKGLCPVYDVFYVPYGREQLDSYVINETAKGSIEPLNAFVIIDSEQQIPKLNLSDSIQIVSYVTVSPEGFIKYLS